VTSRSKSFLILFILALVAATGLLLWVWLFQDLPALEDLPERLRTPSVRIVDRNDRLLYEALYQEGGRNTVVPLESIPQDCRQATIATEDRSFYTNPGVDLRGMVRAAWINLQGGQTIAGGSTITQQVVRNLLLETGERGERSLRRKLREAILAWQLTQRKSKDDILGLYLNQTYYGGMAYGIEAAAQTFFGKPASRLDLAECALLAGLPQAPAVYNPFTDLESSRKRQKVVLNLMAADGYISAEQEQLAEREELVLAESPYPIEAPHFVMLVRNQIDKLFSPEDIYQQGGLVVHTTLDLDWQRQAEEAIKHQLEALQRSPDDLGHNVNNAALVALDPHNGEILALVGSPDYFNVADSGAIDMAISPRQPGSALKPLVYAAALDPSSPTGGWTAATMLLDVQTSFLTADGKAYTPANYDLREHGPVLVRTALASSLNIPAVLTLDHVGLQSLFSFATKLGISTLSDPKGYDLSLALGGGAVRLIELTAAYGAFANGGYRVEPHAIQEVRNLHGDLLYNAPGTVQQRVMDERIAWLISDILSDNDARRLGFGANSLLRLDRPAAVKTGTTSNFHDNWTVGYTPDLVVGVWSGNTNYEPMREVNGLSGAAPIWHQFMRTVLAEQPIHPFIQPQGLTQVEICALSGTLPGEACPYRRKEWFIQGTQPKQVDSLYRQVIVDKVTGRLADENTPPDQRLNRVVLDLPPEAGTWAHSQGLQLYNDLAPDAQVATNSTQGSNLTPATPPIEAVGLEISSPATGSIFHLSPEFASDAQRIQLVAVGQPGLSNVTLWVDGVQVARLESAPYQTWWTLTPGEHRIWAEAFTPEGKKLTSPIILFTVN
jgi:1A family penicillin-binding protein